MASTLDHNKLRNILDHSIYIDALGKITVSTTALIRSCSRVPTVAEAHRLLTVAVQAVQHEATQIEQEHTTDDKTAGQVDFSR